MREHCTSPFENEPDVWRDEPFRGRKKKRLIMRVPTLKISPHKKDYMKLQMSKKKVEN